VGGFAAHAVIVIGSVIVPDDLAANYHRVGGITVPQTVIPPPGETGIEATGLNAPYVQRQRHANDYFRYFSNHAIVRRR
jgi:hypothetical protein